MCGRFIMLTYDEIADVIRSIEMDTPCNIEPDWPARRPCAYPGSVIPVITDVEGDLVAQSLKWGFETDWKQGLVFNTRLETAIGSKSGMWARPIHEGRCIVASAGFFEPHETETVRSPKSGRQIKRQYLFEAPNGHPTLLAAVKDSDSFSIVTTKPNGQVAPIHKRMPIVLSREEAPIWLKGDFASLADRNAVKLTVRSEDSIAESNTPVQQRLL